MVDSVSWFWASDWGRDRLLREELELQANYTSQALSRQRRDANQLRNRLTNLEGSLTERVDALSRAFSAYVELDAITQQLAGYPDHARAEREALEDLHSLVAGQVPRTREDVDGFWLVPAIAALRPDGSLDRALAQRAIERDENAARRLWLTVRAALGAGADLVDELAALMSPTDVDGRACWDEVQLMWWAATLRGAFGTHALPRLHQVVRPVVEATPEADWENWVRTAATIRRPRNRLASGREIGEEAALSWLGDRLSEVTEPVGSTTADDLSWRMVWQTVPTSAPATEHGPSEADSEEPPEETPGTVADADTARLSTQGMLVQLAEHLAGLGQSSIHDLQRRAAELRREIANPTGTEETAAALNGLPARTTPVLDVLRGTALDANASQRDRRLVWSWFAPRLHGWLAAIASRPIPPPATRPIGTDPSLLVTASGVVDQQRLSAARDRQLSGLVPAARIQLVLIGLVVAAVVAVALGAAAIATGLGRLWFGVFASAAVAGWLGRYRRRLSDQNTATRARITWFDDQVTTAIAWAQEDDRKAAARQERLTATATRALSLLPDEPDAS